VTVTEGDAAVFNVTLSEPASQTVRVNFRAEPYFLNNNVSTADVDFQSISGTLTFEPGTTTQTVSIPVKDDGVDELDEAFALILSVPINAVIHDARGIGTILDGDAPPAVTIEDASAAEDYASYHGVAFTVTLSEASAKPIEVQYQTLDGTATSPSDYYGRSDKLVFAAGETRKTLSITSRSDKLYEPDETFFVNLTGTTNATIADGQGQGTLVNDDPVPTLRINQTYVREGASGMTDAVFEVTLTNGTYQTVIVNYTTADGTATAGSDYVAASGSVTFNPGETAKSIKVQVIGDSVDEANETFTVNLSNVVNATMGTAQAVCRIDDDDGPTITVNDISVIEGDVGTTHATFTATLSAISPDPVWFYYTTADGTAFRNSDYKHAFYQYVEVAPGQISTTFDVQLFGDLKIEPDETFKVNLFNPSGGTIADAQGIGTILNDDAGWKSTDIAVGTDNKTRVLWTHPDGRASLWTVAAGSGNLESNFVVGPFAGWIARQIVVGADNKTRVLWINLDGQASLWTVSEDNSHVESHYEYGPFPVWTAIDMAIGADNKPRILWTNGSGQASLRTVAAKSATVESNFVSGPFEKWRPLSIATGGDNKTRVLWTNGNGQASLWTVSATNPHAIESNFIVGPYEGWTARGIGVGADNRTRVLWTYMDGRISLWVMRADGGLDVNDTYGPFAGWSAQVLGAGADNKMRVLWRHTDGRASTWTVSPVNSSLEEVYSYGPYW
jgi:hypothetical protein